MVKDWFKLILWYIRLRRAAKSTTKQQGNNDKQEEKAQAYMPHSLLKVAKRIQVARGKPMKTVEGIEVLQKAKLSDYKDMKAKTRAKAQQNDSDDEAVGYDSSSSDDAQLLVDELERLDQQNPLVEELDETHTEVDDEKLLNKEEMQNQLMKLTTKMNSAKNLRNFLGGVQLHLVAQGLVVQVFALKQILKGGKPVPNFIVDVDNFSMSIECYNEALKKNLAVLYSLKMRHIKCIDTQRCPSRQVEKNGISVQESTARGTMSSRHSMPSKLQKPGAQAQR